MHSSHTPSPEDAVIGRWSVLGMGGLAYVPLAEGNGQSLVDFRSELGVSAQYTLGERTRLAGMISGTPFQSGDSTTKQGAISDPHLGLIRTLKDTTPPYGGSLVPYRWGLALAAWATAPLGTDDGWLGDRGATVRGEFITDAKLLNIEGSLRLAWLHRFEKVAQEDPRWQDELWATLGGKVRIPGLQSWSILAEVHGQAHATRLSTRTDHLGTRVRAGVKRDLRGHWWTLTAGAGRSGGYGTPLADVTFTLGRFPSLSYDDVDRDHVPDEDDLCKFLPEDYDGFEDGDGCLDPDDDRDMVMDDDDRCPKQQAEEGRDANGDGCTDR